MAGEITAPSRPSETGVFSGGSVDDIARYYRTYLDLMEHWDRALPDRVLRVHHEDVVDDLEGSVRRILDYCGLAFEPACVDFHKTRRSVRTPSSEQVRQPIFRDGIEQWRMFEPWLRPLGEALGNAGSPVPIDTPKLRQRKRTASQPPARCR